MTVNILLWQEENSQKQLYTGKSEIPPVFLAFLPHALSSV